MPELPEVETYLRGLEPMLRQRRVLSAHVGWSRTVAVPSATDFVRRVVGQVFVGFERRGKYMIFALEQGESLIVHLRMTGKLFLTPSNVEPGKHTHVVMQLDNGEALHFQDPRKFGRMWLVWEPQEVLHKLGPEPFEPAFSVPYLAERCAGRRANIKALLLDQGIVAGVGNIYADEALFAARIHPAKAAGALGPEELQRLHQSVIAVLAKAIEMEGSSLGGSSLQNYLRQDGEQGGFQEQHQVFRRTGQACRICGAPIQRIVLAQRSTHFCPACQVS